ncbi:MAG: DNA replication/repair protein RecF [Gammaproteobacteria bacterium]
MAIFKLEVNGLRNLNDVSIEPREGFNFIIGDNGSGKTSLLEAIHCLGRGKSFRNHKTNKLIEVDSETFTVVGKITQKGRDHTVGMRRSRQGSQIRLSGKPINSLSELIALQPIALLEPGLHRLVEEGPEYRRKFMDWGVFHVEPAFASIWRTFRRALAQRNAALRDRWSHQAIKQWDTELVIAAEKLDQIRSQYLTALKIFIKEKITTFEGLPSVDVSYQRGWREGPGYGEYLAAQFDSDKERGFTQFGPHRADMRLRVGSQDARDVLSRGQQKLLVATLVLAQCQQMAAQNTSTVILVDDLPAELDSDKRKALLGALEDTGAQIFVTGTEKGLFGGADFSQAGVFHVEQGRVQTLE